MVRKFASIALAGAIALAAAPASAQEITTNPLGLPIVPNIGIDLDPFHIFTPAPAPAPAAAPAPMMHRHHHHHMMMHHHHHMMMHHKMKMMHHKKMMKKKM